MARTYPWKVSDALWERVEPLLPACPPHPKGGRPTADDRQMFAAIVSVLRTGIQWNALPRELGASSTVYDRLRQAGLQEYDELARIGWEGPRVDGSMVKAPFAQAAKGVAPTDGGKQGPKRSILCDRRGLPLALMIEGANCPDRKLLSATLDSQIVESPEPTVEQPHHFCLDAGSDDEPIYADLSLRGYEPHVRLNPHSHQWYWQALQRHGCNDRLGHLFEKEALWAVSPASFSLSDGTEPSIQEGESFSFTREHTGIWPANHRGRYIKGAGEACKRPLQP